MVKVALAGAGSLGGHILNGLQAYPSKYEIVVISRKPQPNLTARGISVKICDYTSVDSLAAALSGVDIVLSTLVSVSDVDSARQSQLLLVEAAKRAGVRRFAPSEWAISVEGNKTLTLYGQVKPAVWEALKVSGMQYTAFRPGVFMNYFAYGSEKQGVIEEVFNDISHMTFLIDIAKGTAEVPGTGNEKLNSTLIQDVGRLVAIGLEKDEVWEREENGMAGSIITFNGLIAEVERITGKKIKVKYESIPFLEQKIAEETTVKGKFGWEIRLAIARGQGFVKPTLNETLPDVRVTTITEFLEKWWGKE